MPEPKIEQRSANFWGKIKQTLDAMEKTEMDHVWDQIHRIQDKLAKLDAQLQTVGRENRDHPEA